jgi:hypothetical protein
MIFGEISESAHWISALILGQIRKHKSISCKQKHENLAIEKVSSASTCLSGGVNENSRLDATRHINASFTLGWRKHSHSHTLCQTKTSPGMISMEPLPKTEWFHACL